MNVAKAGVTLDQLSATAGAVADSEGFSALSMSAVAKQLGVSVPALYKHVDGLPGLQRLLALRSTQELGDVMTSSVMGRSGRDALHALCHDYRQFAKDRPGRYAATVRAPASDDEEHQRVMTRALTPVLAILEGYGLPESALIDAARYLRSTLHGFVVIELAGGFGIPRDIDESFERVVTAMDWTIRSWEQATVLT